MPNIYIFTVATGSVFFSVCTFMLIYQLIYSLYFRKNIANTHNFSEGIMTGIAYPLLWVVYGFIAVQFFSFILIYTESEIFLAIRLMLFALSIIAFYVLKSVTPTLLAYWFGKTSFWESKGTNGKIPFSDIYCVKVHKKKTSRFINNQQLYKITFYVKNKTFLLIPKKYVCRMTAKQISVLTPFVNFKECKKPRPSKKAVLYSVFAPVLLFSVILCCFTNAISIGLLNSEKYTSSSDKLSKASTEPIKTVSKITSVATSGNYVYVFYGEPAIINAYDTDGNFLFAYSLPNSYFGSNDIACDNDTLVYKYRNKNYGYQVVKYSSSGDFISTEAYDEQVHAVLFEGNEVKAKESGIIYGDFGVKSGSTSILSRASYLRLFDTKSIWSLTVVLIICLFALKQYVTADKKLQVVAKATDDI